MSKVWPHVTKENPCPICGKPDWCVIGERKVVCMRVQSTHLCRSGGWYHDLAGAPVSLPPRQYIPPPAQPFLERKFQTWRSRTTESRVNSLAVNLGVSRESLEMLDASLSLEHSAWAFPMRDHNNKIVGIRLRALGGAKWAVTGSRQGLFIPQNYTLTSPLYVCEGPTSTAAMLTMGLPAIGRASCETGAEMLRDFLKVKKIWRVIIVGDNDHKLRPDGTHWSPGIEGAQRLGRAIGVRYVVWTPPTKDVRDYLKAGATKATIESQVKDFVWRH